MVREYARDVERERDALRDRLADAESQSHLAGMEAERGRRREIERLQAVIKSVNVYGKPSSSTRQSAPG